MNDQPQGGTARDRSNGCDALCETLNALLADSFILYLKTKGFHWHMTGPHFRDYHLLLDDQASQIFATTDVIAERVRKLGGATLRSIDDIQRFGRIKGEDGHSGTAPEMLEQLRKDNLELAGRLRGAHAQCSAAGDVATTSLLENFIDEVEQRIWFLTEAA